MIPVLLNLIAPIYCFWLSCDTWLHRWCCTLFVVRQWTMEEWYSNWHNRSQWWRIFGGGSVTSSSLVHAFTRMVVSSGGKLLRCQCQIQSCWSYAGVISKVRIENNCRGWEYLILFAHNCSQCTSVDTPNQHSSFQTSMRTRRRQSTRMRLCYLQLCGMVNTFLKSSMGWVSPH